MIRVYRIVGDNGVYIGSTTLTLNERMYRHKHNPNKCSSSILENPKIELIEECAEEERYIREQYWMDNTECVNQQRAVPQKRPPRTEPWRFEIVNCECGGHYRKCAKSRHFRSKIHINYLQ